MNDTNRLFLQVLAEIGPHVSTYPSDTTADLNWLDCTANDAAIVIAPIYESDARFGMETGIHDEFAVRHSSQLRILGVVHGWALMKDEEKAMVRNAAGREYYLNDEEKSILEAMLQEREEFALLPRGLVHDQGIAMPIRALSLCSQDVEIVHDQPTTSTFSQQRRFMIPPPGFAILAWRSRTTRGITWFFGPFDTDSNAEDAADQFKDHLGLQDSALAESMVTANPCRVFWATVYNPGCEPGDLLALNILYFMYPHQFVPEMEPAPFQDKDLVGWGRDISLLHRGLWGHHGRTTENVQQDTPNPHSLWDEVGQARQMNLDDDEDDEEYGEDQEDDSDDYSEDGGQYYLSEEAYFQLRRFLFGEEEPEEEEEPKKKKKFVKKPPPKVPAHCKRANKIKMPPRFHFMPQARGQITARRMIKTKSKNKKKGSRSR